MFSPDFKIESSKDSSTASLREAIAQIGVLKIIERGKVILSNATISDFFFVVTKGVFKTVKYIDRKEFILGFTFPGDIDGEPQALLGHSLTPFSVKAVVASEVLICRWHDLETFLQKEKYLVTVNYFLIQYIAILQNRLIESIALTAEERYKNLIQHHAQHLKQIPISDLARYLGITKQSLSRIRSKKF